MQGPKEDPGASMPGDSVSSEKLSKGSLLKGSFVEKGKGSGLVRKEYGQSSPLFRASPLTHTDSLSAVT